MASKARFEFTRQLFLRSLAVVYFLAFVSLWLQIDGLVGDNGIEPIRTYLAEAHIQFGYTAVRLLPTLCWLSRSNTFLHYQCLLGAIASVVAITGIAQLPAFVIAFICYLSLTVAGQDFLEFQWDSLLLEAGFLAIFFSPWELLPRRQAPPSRSIRWMLRWLTFRVMFMSGVVKLSSGDPNWRTLDALRFHYFTQPLPPWTAWYMIQLPLWFQRLSCGVVFFAELVIPPLIFGPRIFRLIAFWAISAFQLLVAATGNFGFFNLLTIVLCFTLPDDRFWIRILHRKQCPLPMPQSRRRWPALVTIPISIFLATLTIPPFIDCFRTDFTWPNWVAEYQDFLGPFRLASGYGLFAVMTTSRPELIIEGSDDMETWKEYGFPWKIGDLDRRPMFCSPYMPRLDWQMWFAALGAPENSPWVFSFMTHLAQGTPDVLKLIKVNPFPEHPPQYVRASLYEYEFTTPQERSQSGAWWKRKLVGVWGELSRP